MAVSETSRHQRAYSTKAFSNTNRRDIASVVRRARLAHMGLRPSAGSENSDRTRLTEYMATERAHDMCSGAAKPGSMADRQKGEQMSRKHS